MVDRPLLPYPLGEYFEAFMDLDGRRQAGYAAEQPLTAEAILGYGYAFCFGEDIQFFFKVMAKLDNLLLKDKARRRKEAAPPKKPKAWKPRSA